MENESTFGEKATALCIIVSFVALAIVCLMSCASDRHVFVAFNGQTVADVSERSSMPWVVGEWNTVIDGTFNEKGMLTMKVIDTKDKRTIEHLGLAAGAVAGAAIGAYAAGAPGAVLGGAGGGAAGALIDAGKKVK